MAAQRNSILEDTFIRTTGIGPLHYPKNIELLCVLFNHAQFIGLPAISKKSTHLKK